MSMPYWVELQDAELRLFQIGATNSAVIFFRKLLNPSNCIHHLLPLPSDSEITSRLRRATTYPRPRNRTNYYQSFIHHALLRPISLSLVYCYFFIALHCISFLVLYCIVLL